MKCPNDNATLLMTDRQGIEIDYCPECRGIWLDRGELDKLINASANQQPAPMPPTLNDESRYIQQSHDNSYYKKKKRKDFLGDIFDF